MTLSVTSTLWRIREDNSFYRTMFFVEAAMFVGWIVILFGVGRK